MRTNDLTVAAGHSVARWQELFDELMGRLAHRFGRVEPRRRARAFVKGLLASLPRKNCWTIAEHAGDPTPDGMQHLLARAVWDHDGVRDDVRGWAVEHLGPDGVLVVDETGDLKKGECTAGVSVWLAYATRRGHALVDRELYVPKGWAGDPERRRAAGIPDALGFATKPELAARMVGRALDAGVAARWVAADEVYGANPRLRSELEARGTGYVLAVGCDHRVRAGGARHRADDLVARAPARAWQTVSCGNGAKGDRLYDWAFIRLRLDDGPARHGAPAAQRWLVARRSLRTGELAFYHCWTPRPALLSELVTVAGMRWTIEERFQGGKGLAGLDSHQLRSYRSWYRWATLVLVAYAFLVVAALLERAHHPPPAGLAPISCNELAHLLVTLAAPPAHNPAYRLRWSAWRRRHQHRARTRHYQRQHTRPP